MSHTNFSAAVECLQLAENLEGKVEPVHPRNRAILANYMIEKAKVYALLGINRRLEALKCSLEKFHRLGLTIEDIGRE